MALTPSNMIPLGTKAPDFELIDAVSGEKKSLRQLKSNVATVIMFICNHCPFVKHISHVLAAMAEEYMKKGISFVAISANDAAGYPEDAPEKMREVARNLGYPFPYLYDEEQVVAKAYDAACTPDFYIFDKELQCVYRGQFDSARPGNNISVTGQDVRAALDNIIANKPVSPQQKPSMGCNIKWKQ